MTMTFFLHDSIQPNAPLDLIEHGSASRRATGEFPLSINKLRIPDIEPMVERERLVALLQRSRSQYPATLISGRAGTGKTALAASLAARSEKAAWYTVETTDADWNVFSRYLSQCLVGAGFGDGISMGSEKLRYTAQNEIAKFLVRHFMRTEQRVAGEETLIVIDDVHHIFDAEWFGEFFKLLLYSLPASTHLLLLCRSKPPAPLWRLRSKQVLNVIEEDQLAFTTDETRQLFDLYGCPDKDPAAAREECFGRASKLSEWAAFNAA